ncbi:MAG TPA: response regulator [Candidatus Yaniella excrementavium]|nr:response regulator [Candidatus Yaniella excrementavium]
MYMSVEMIATIITAVGLLATLGGGLFAGFAWVLRRMDEEFATVDKRFVQVDARFAQVDERFAKAQISFNDRFAQADTTTSDRLALAEVSLDKRFAQAEARLDTRFAQVEQKLDKMDERMNGVQTELTEVKVAVARLEGPRQRLIIPH